jgi:transcriptional regulator with XRE-family HTH domain
MSDFGSSAARQVRLASELRRLRKRTRLTGREVAARLEWSVAKLSRIENGLTRVKIDDLHRFMDLYDVPSPDRADLIALGEESREADLLSELGGDLPEGHAQVLQAESEAEAIWIWEPQVVPGLLQLEEYTRALLQLWPGIFARPAQAIERRVETRQLRQRALTRDPPPELLFVIDESVLLRRVASPTIMRSQLARLAEVSEESNIELRVLPLKGDQVIGTGAFNYFRFPEIHGFSRPDTVAFEHLQGTTFAESELDVNTYQRIFKALRDKSLGPQASHDILLRVSRDLWS